MEMKWLVAKERASGTAREMSRRCAFIGYGLRNMNLTCRADNFLHTVSRGALLETLQEGIFFMVHGADKAAT